MKALLGVVLVVGSLVVTQATTMGPPPLEEVGKNAVLGDMGDTTVENWLKTLISKDTDLPAFENVGPSGDGSGLKFTFPNTGSCDYLILHWGGKGGGIVQAFYLGDSEGELEFKAPGKNGLSGWRTYNCKMVPDGGLTVTLLGLGLLGVGFVQRRMRS